MDLEGLVGGEEWIVRTEESRMFGVLMNSERHFSPCRRQKKNMLNFPPEVVIWWTLKMYNQFQ